MPQPQQSALLTAALAAAERGWPVIPLRPGSKVPALHGEHRCPGVGDCASGHRTWEQRATTDPARIERCWTAGPFNVGIATGPAGLLVVDLDTLKPTDEKGTPDGVSSFLALCERAGQPVPTTRRIRTASGGEHLYFTAPAGVRLGNTAGTLASKIDTRGWGGQVVAPGSETPHGRYTVAEDSPVAELPEWLHGALTVRQRAIRTAVVPLATRASGYAAAALRGEVQNVVSAPDGTRNATVLRAARALGRLVASGDLARGEVEEAFSRGASDNATQSQRYYDDVIRRGLDWSIAHNTAGRRTA